jgi:transglutaminase-like putative cysteine protease
MVLTIKYPGIKETLNYLIKQIRDSLSFASSFVRTYKIKDARHLFDVLKNIITYKNDPQGIEYIQSFQTFAKNGYIGDCDCFTVAAVSALYVLGYKVAIILQARRVHNPCHIMAGFKFNNKWYAFDLTNNTIGYIRNYPLTQIISLTGSL